MSAFNELLFHPAFDTRADYLNFPTRDQIRQVYERARLISQKSDLTIEDIVKLQPKFWDIHRHPLMVKDLAVGTALTIHWNLCIGTLASYLPYQPHLAPLLQRLIQFELCGEFMLTEIGHGLDARNLETTATLQPDGSFDLHTPRPSAAKVMPPNSPWAGMGRVGIVFARLMIDEEDHGVKSFIVYLGDENGLLPGVKSQLLPKRCGAKALDHSITTFDHVRLTPGSLLGSPARAQDLRTDFMRRIHRVAVGTLSLSIANIPVLGECAMIAGAYSRRRHVAGHSSGSEIPIIQFPTQYRPILDALVQSWAYNAFADEAISLFLDPSFNHEVHHAVAACFKIVVNTDTQAAITELSERCGWQGLFAYNRMIEMELSMRGNAIAEGDQTVLCIRLVSEVLLGRYKLPEPKMPTCLLARHEAGVWKEAREMIEALGDSNHRSEEVNAHLLPRCRHLVKATGYRMAYEAAVRTEKLRPEALRLFESTCVKTDLSWYCEFEQLSRNEFLANDTRIAREALPLLHEVLCKNDHASVVRTPIMDEESWDEFVSSLPTFESPMKLRSI